MNTWHTSTGTPFHGGGRIGGKRRTSPMELLSAKQRRKAKLLYFGGALEAIEEEGELADVQQLSEEAAASLPTNTTSTTTSVAHLHGKHNLLRIEFQRKLRLHSPPISGEKKSQVTESPSTSSPMPLCELEEKQENPPQLAAEFNNPAGMRPAPAVAHASSHGLHEPICQTVHRQVARVEPMQRTDHFGGAAVIRRDTNPIPWIATEEQFNQWTRNMGDKVDIAEVYKKIADGLEREAADEREAVEAHKRAAAREKEATEAHKRAAEGLERAAAREKEVAEGLLRAAAKEKEAREARTIEAATLVKEQSSSSASTLHGATTSNAMVAVGSTRRALLPATTTNAVDQQRLEAEVTALSDALRQLFALPQAKSFRGSRDTMLEKVKKLGQQWHGYRDAWDLLEAAFSLFDSEKSSALFFSKEMLDHLPQHMNPVMQQLGYCCGYWRRFTLFRKGCCGLNAKGDICPNWIKAGELFWCYQPAEVQEPYNCCGTCYGRRGRIVTILTGDGERETVEKSSFYPVKHDQHIAEPFLLCRCGRRWHRICAIRQTNSTTGEFICPQCRVDKSIDPEEKNPFSAKALPQCDLSRHVEQRVKGFLQKKDPTTTPAVFVRVLVNSKKEMVVLPQMKKARYPHFPESFPYTAKGLFAFSYIDGQEVCFYGMHVQEYGNDASEPNKQRVYLAYLDSVLLPELPFRGVNRQIILGYLDWAGNEGYGWAHIWSSSPRRPGNDYLFRGHPTEQEEHYPSDIKLREWYIGILKQAQLEKIIPRFSSLYDHIEEGLITATNAMPYFNNDHWSKNIEVLLKEAEGKKTDGSDPIFEQLKKEVRANKDYFFAVELAPAPAATAPAATAPAATAPAATAPAATAPAATAPATTAPAATAPATTAPAATAPATTAPAATAPATTAPAATTSAPVAAAPAPSAAAPTIGGEHMELMQIEPFLERAEKEHWEFTSARHAIYSTYRFAQALHTQDDVVLGLRFTCSACFERAAAHHCSTCKRAQAVYNLCDKCYAAKHPEHDPTHQWEWVAVFVDRRPAPKEALSRCIEVLHHTCDCKTDNCGDSECDKMKRLLDKHRCEGVASCTTCQQSYAIRRCHAQQCVGRENCGVPSCSELRHELEEVRRRRSSQADRQLMERAKSMEPNDPAKPFTGATGSQTAVVPGAKYVCPALGRRTDSTRPSSAYGHSSLHGSQGLRSPLAEPRGGGTSTGRYLSPCRYQTTARSGSSTRNVQTLPEGKWRNPSPVFQAPTGSSGVTNAALVSGIGRVSLRSSTRGDVPPINGNPRTWNADQLCQWLRDAGIGSSVREKLRNANLIGGVLFEINWKSIREKMEKEDWLKLRPLLDQLKKASEQTEQG